MFEAACFALLVTLAGALVRALLGPTVFDRTQAVNSAGTVAMLLLAAVGFLTGRPDFLDVAIIYGLLNVIGTIAVLKFFRHGDLGDPGDEPEEMLERRAREKSS
jgi:multicomponent Na+:H+ antiporter subunit F